MLAVVAENTVPCVCRQIVSSLQSSFTHVVRGTNITDPGLCPGLAQSIGRLHRLKQEVLGQCIASNNQFRFIFLQLLFTYLEHVLMIPDCVGDGAADVGPAELVGGIDVVGVPLMPTQTKYPA